MASRAQLRFAERRPHRSHQGGVQERRVDRQDA